MYVVIFCLSYEQKIRTIMFRNMEILAGVMIGEIFVILVTMLLTMRYDFDLILDAVNIRWGIIYSASKICECAILNIMNKISDNIDKKKICTFRINGAPFPRQRCKRLAPAVRYPFVVTC